MPIGERAALLTYSMSYNYNPGTAQSQLFGMRIDVQGAAGASANADRPLKSDERVSDATFAARWGVQTHWSQEPLAPGRMTNLSRAFGAARIDFTWTLVEKTPGVYDFAQYDALVSAMAGVGVRPQFSLNYGNSLYNCSSGPGVIGPPATPAATGAFVRFVIAAMTHFAGKGVVWELWNEPNDPSLFPPKADAVRYVILASKVGAAKQAAKHLASEMLVGPAADGGFAIEMQPGGWLYTVLQAGLLRWVDGVSVHPYRGDGCAPHLPPSFCKACAQSAAGCGPESALEDYSTLRGIIAKFAAAAGKVRARIFSPAYSAVT